ncbi:heterokaryon incompatibility protein [Glarea lozoyensis ATCC 20868]|uniref:Heterokaryon incompatibility protein n=1 Tax=Glarea lozoyensis (strain ATCC 20868 / MF5171) TaxID=1116229 RepID=S3CW43_GLAL2|nr:heterokaryon incompatibility protein [Glarea lozoyensis ATCC 20868]EPE30622.1 heterokaryon incompatibility protein [Glarea lozoyensis ATCC 20868]
MICSVCYGMLRGHQGSEWRGTYDLIFNHHSDLESLVKSAKESCVICRSLLAEISELDHQNQDSEIETIPAVPLGFYNFFRKLFYLEWLAQKGPVKAVERSKLTSAYLSEIFKEGYPGIYRLDFKLHDKRRVGTFVLHRVDARADEVRQASLVKTSVTSTTEKFLTSMLHTPFSESTESGEALSLARSWMADCGKNHKACPRGPKFNDWYPSRLLDLGEPDKDNKRVQSNKVHLISTSDTTGRFKEGFKIENEFYVTLSHCWGKAKFTTLTENNIEEFHEEGIEIDTLPKSFQDAIRFSRRLSKYVRYIWIDSLCIIQGKSKNQYEDWLRESASMHRIYQNSYCNLSATAATDSEKGLFFDGAPHQLWEDDINLNVEGIPGRNKPWQKSLPENPFDTPINTVNKPKSVERQQVERCRILDVSFWQRHVDDAPVNRRGWVLQERIMAPRVLHFCSDQIAWECRELEASESSRSGLQNFRMQAGDIVRKTNLKTLIPHLALADQDSQISYYQNWNRVVEVYSKLGLRNPEDKLIALSGIASIMHRHIKDDYLGGMWRTYLESQLLWYVDPWFEEGRFYYMSERATEYRAPSFSWAAIDAKHGVKCGEITDNDLHFEVLKINVQPKSEDNPFGLIKTLSDGVTNVMEIGGLVKRIVMSKPVDPNGVERYEWKLVPKDNTSVESHRNVFLDSPDSDNLLGLAANLYCMAARTDAAGYFICLLLQLEKNSKGEGTGYYKRVGLTKVPNYEKGHEEVLGTSIDDKDIPSSMWDAEKKRHVIELV